ncbi:uncharacterized protein LOC117201828 [Orcinus orca]|uniref:uncharacterized protein LOC117201828 n=1 Tax=Orcinus orca TaxID=9733 RepID=UPI002111A27D|nr:uncharacterized protein LOC117201828 [Orcinus orca]
MNCTGNETVCFTLSGTWRGEGPQILKGCATPEVCHLQANTTLGPEATGFHLTAKPECNHVAPTTHPGPHVPVTHTKAKVTVCFTCSDLHHCNPLPCTEDRNYCLQIAGITGGCPCGQDWAGEEEMGPETPKTSPCPPVFAALTPAMVALFWPWRTEAGGSGGCELKIRCHVCHSYS